MKNISTHITALLSGVTGVIALVHPGFHLPAFVQGLTTTVCAVLSVAVEMRHMTFKHQASMAEHFAVAAANATVAPTVDATPATK